MPRVVVTGLGIVSSLGCTLGDAAAALRSGNSGLAHLPEMAARGLPCSLFGPVRGLDESVIEARARRTMSRSALFAAVASLGALQDAGWDPGQLAGTRTAAVIGAEYGGAGEISSMHRLLAAGKKSRAGGTGVTKYMNSTAAGNVASLLALRGRAYSVASQAATGIDAIGQACELIQRGLADAALCGATEEECWQQVGPSMARWHAFPTHDNDRPASACRPFDRQRNGLVLSAGSGMLFLETLEKAQTRGARIYAEIVGYGSAHKGSEPFRISGRGLPATLRQSLDQARSSGVEQFDYVNSGAAGTRHGDAIEAQALREILGRGPWVSSTQGQTGHALAASSALQAVLTLLMMSHDFVAPTANLEHIAPECDGLRHVPSLVVCHLNTAACVTGGLGGFNAAWYFVG